MTTSTEARRERACPYPVKFIGWRLRPARICVACAALDVASHSTFAGITPGLAFFDFVTFSCTIQMLANRMGSRGWQLDASRRNVTWTRLTHR